MTHIEFLDYRTLLHWKKRCRLSVIWLTKESYKGNFKNSLGFAVAQCSPLEPCQIMPESTIEWFNFGGELFPLIGHWWENEVLIGSQIIGAVASLDKPLNVEQLSICTDRVTPRNVAKNLAKWRIKGYPDPAFRFFVDKAAAFINFNVGASLSL